MSAKPKVPRRGLTFSAGSHRYRLDGKPVTGVTTLIGSGLPKPALPYWAAKKVAERVESNFDQVRADYSAMSKGQFIDSLKRAPWDERDRSAIRGTSVHALAAELVNGVEVEVPQELEPYVSGYAEWLDAHEVRPILTESLVGNRSEWYAGTTDLVAEYEGRPMLLDLKTSTSIHGSYALQCAAYAHAEFWQDADGVEHPMPQVEGIGAVHVTDSGSYLVEFPDPDAAWTMFRHVAYVAKNTKTIDSWGEDKRK